MRIYSKIKVTKNVQILQPDSSFWYICIYGRKYNFKTVYEFFQNNFIYLGNFKKVNEFPNSGGGQ